MTLTRKLESCRTGKERQNEVGNCEVRGHSIVANFFSIPIQKLQAPQLPVFLIPFCFMFPIFVSNLKFFRNGLANKRYGILPQVGSLWLLLGTFIPIEPVITSFTSGGRDVAAS